MKNTLLGASLTELEVIVKDAGLPRFTAKQIAQWLYVKKVHAFDEMTNLSKKARAFLQEKYELGVAKPVKVSKSSDGTKKYLFATGDGKFIETAYIPDKDRHTLCVSSQVGCKMGCVFCATARQGFQGNLTAAQILNQIISVPESDKLTNVVYMGMGEPFDNLDNVLKSLDVLVSDYGFAWSPKRITVSTIGLVPGIKRFLDESQCHLALSLHSAHDETRRKLMPIGNVYAIEDVIEEIRNHDFGRQRRISFEYILFKGINDSPADIKRIASLLHGMRCRINLIRFHDVPSSTMKPSSRETMEWFRDTLNEKGITTTIRASRGEDIQAACGLLSTKETLKDKREG